MFNHTHWIHSFQSILEWCIKIQYTIYILLLNLFPFMWSSLSAYNPNLQITCTLSTCLMCYNETWSSMLMQDSLAINEWCIPEKRHLTLSLQLKKLPYPTKNNLKIVFPYRIYVHHILLKKILPPPFKEKKKVACSPLSCCKMVLSWWGRAWAGGIMVVFSRYHFILQTPNQHNILSRSDFIFNLFIVHNPFLMSAW